jgi:hypothetical protein
MRDRVSEREIEREGERDRERRRERERERERQVRTDSDKHRQRWSKLKGTHTHKQGDILRKTARHTNKYDNNRQKQTDRHK